jgi:AcrR family transcriptional regulator
VSAKPVKSGGKRGARGEATRQAILESARRAFTLAGYDGVGVREIAKNAGVTAMLVNRYFGSKERLFEEVVAKTLGPPSSMLFSALTHHSGDAVQWGRDIAVALVARTTPDVSIDGFLILLRSASHEQAAAILRKAVREQFAAPLAAQLTDAQAAERAAIMLSIVAGFQFMRQVIELPTLADADPAMLADQLQRVFDVLINNNRAKVKTTP